MACLRITVPALAWRSADAIHAVWRRRAARSRTAPAIAPRWAEAAERGPDDDGGAEECGNRVELVRNTVGISATTCRASSRRRFQSTSEESRHHRRETELECFSVAGHSKEGQTSSIEDENRAAYSMDGWKPAKVITPRWTATANSANH